MTTPEFSELFPVLHGGDAIEAREARLASAADDLAGERRSVFGNDRFLLTLAAGLMTFGIAIIALGWVGAAHAIHVEEQVPYLISGGLIGVALTIVGAQCLFAHWLTVSIREARAHDAARRKEHEELMQRLTTLAAAGGREEVSANGRASGPRPERPLRRAPRSP